MTHFKRDTAIVIVEENESIAGLTPGQTHVFRPGQPGFLELDTAASWLRGPPVATLVGVSEEGYTFAIKKGTQPGKATFANQDAQRGGRIADVKFTTSDGKVVDKKTSKSRDWLCGDNAFHFTSVKSIDAAGQEIDVDYVPKVPAEWPTDMMLQVKGLEGSSIEHVKVPAHSFDSVKRLRDRISASLGVPLLQLQLIFNGQLLDENDRMLSSFALMDGCVVRAILKAAKPDDAYQPLSAQDSETLNGALDRVRTIGLHIRASMDEWSAQRQQRREAAEHHLASTLKKLQEETGTYARSYASVWGRELACSSPGLGSLLFPSVGGAPAEAAAAVGGLSRSQTAGSYLESVNPGQPERPPLVVALLALLSTMTRGHLAVLHSHQGLSKVGFAPAEQQAFADLNSAIMGMREAGNEADVDVNELPVSWRLDLDWVIPPKTRAITDCFMGCGSRVFLDEHEGDLTGISAHTNNYAGPCNPDIGVVPDDYEGEKSQGTAMGGTQVTVKRIGSI